MRPRSSHTPHRPPAAGPSDGLLVGDVGYGKTEEALARELDRGGQVYFVHNRIETIDTIAERVRALAPPRARIAVAHGKLKEAELDAVMARFVRGEVDILVSTMIVESGLDMPNANTMIVNRANQLG